MKGVVLFCLLAATAAALTIPNADQNSQPKILFPKCFGRLSASNVKDDAITNLRKDKKAVTLTPDPNCENFMAQGCISIDADGRNRRYNPNSDNTCLVGIRQNPLVRGKAGEEVSLYKPGVIPPYVSACSRDENTAAFYLQFEPNKNTFMILDPAKARWFFTKELGGCDIFVATNSNPLFSNKSLVIHANANAVGDNKAANLRLKGEGADEIARANAGYDLVARIYSANPGADLGDYASGHPGVQLCTYNNIQPIKQYFYFIGYFEEKGDVGAWQFFLKGKSSGKITKLSKSQNL